MSEVYQCHTGEISAFLLGWISNLLGCWSNQTLSRVPASNSAILTN